MPKIIVDGEKIEARADANLLEVLLSNNIDMPYFCWHPAKESPATSGPCLLLACPLHVVSPGDVWHHRLYEV